MDRHVLGLGDQPALGVAQRGREVAARVDDLRVGGAQHRLAHLLGDRVQAVLDHRDRDRIDACLRHCRAPPAPAAPDCGRAVTSDSLRSGTVRKKAASMAQQFAQIEPAQRDFILRQHMFFVATAASGGRVNLSPKGLDALRVLGPNSRGLPRSHRQRQRDGRASARRRPVDADDVRLRGTAPDPAPLRPGSRGAARHGRVRAPSRRGVRRRGAARRAPDRRAGRRPRADLLRLRRAALRLSRRAAGAGPMGRGEGRRRARGLPPRATTRTASTACRPACSRTWLRSSPSAGDARNGAGSDWGGLRPHRHGVR